MLPPQNQRQQHQVSRPLLLMVMTKSPLLIPSTSPHSHTVSSQQPVEVEVRPAPPGTPFHPAGSPHLQALPLLPYPIALNSRGRKVYDVAQKGFDILEMFKNPMMLMMLVAGALVFILPKALVRRLFLGLPRCLLEGTFR